MRLVAKMALVMTLCFLILRSELTPEEKMARSHRGKALRELLRLWPAFWETR